MKQAEGHRGGFSPRDPPWLLARGSGMSPGKVLGPPSLLPHPCVVMSAQASRGTLQFAQP